MEACLKHLLEQAKAEVKSIESDLSTVKEQRVQRSKIYEEQQAMLLAQESREALEQVEAAKVKEREQLSKES